MKKSIAYFIILSTLTLFTVNAAETWGAKKQTKPQEEVPIIYRLGDDGNLSLALPTELTELGLPENFSAKTIRPLNKLSYDELKKYGLAVYSYCSDSHKKLRTYYQVDDRMTGSCIDGYYRFSGFIGSDKNQICYDFGYSFDGAFGFGPKDEASYYDEAENLLEEQIPGKSYIITFVEHYGIDKNQIVDLGIRTKEQVLNMFNYDNQQEQKEILDKIKGQKVHLMLAKKEWKLLPGFPVIEKFDGEGATKAFDFGDNEDIFVQIPKTCISSEYDDKKKTYLNECISSIKLNKTQLPLSGVGNGDKVVFIKGYYSDLKTTNKVWSCEMPESVPTPTSAGYLRDANDDNFIPTILKRKHYYEHFGDLGEGYYFLDIKIARKENDYYRSTSGWKVYVPNKDYQEYFDSKVKKGVFQPSEDDKICYKIILLENNGKYELGLKALPYKIEIVDF